MIDLGPALDWQKLDQDKIEPLSQRCSRLEALYVNVRANHLTLAVFAAPRDEVLSEPLADLPRRVFDIGDLPIAVCDPANSTFLDIGTLTDEVDVWEEQEQGTTICLRIRIGDTVLGL